MLSVVLLGQSADMILQNRAMLKSILFFFFCGPHGPRRCWVLPGFAGLWPQREPAWRGGPGKRKDLPEREICGAGGALGRAPVVPKQRGAQGALDGDAKEAPPAAAPPGSGGGADRGRRAPGAKADEAAHEGQGLRVPAAADLAGEDQELLRTAGSKLWITAALAPLGQAERDTIRLSGPRDGGTAARQGGDEGGIAAPRFPMWRGAMHDQVESAAVIGGNVRGVGARKPLLRNDAALGAHSLAGDAHPRVLQDMCAAGESAAAGASCAVVAQAVQRLPTAGSAVTSTAGTRQRQRQAVCLSIMRVHCLFVTIRSKLKVESQSNETSCYARPTPEALNHLRLPLLAGTREISTGRVQVECICRLSANGATVFIYSPFFRESGALEAREAFARQPWPLRIFEVCRRGQTCHVWSS